MNAKRIALFVAAAALTTMLVHAAGPQAADKSPQPSWPDFHGPGRTNISPETGLLKQWPADGPPRIWTYSDCGSGYSGVTIAEGMIFTAGDFDEGEMLIALDMDGKLLWKAPNGEAWRQSSPGSRSTPTYHDGLLYHMSPMGRLAAFRARSGEEVWAVDLVSRFDAQWGIWGLSENVVVEDGKVFCMPGGAKGRVVALDQRTGETIWANTEIEHSAAYCSPVVVSHGGFRQLLTLTQKSLLGIDIQTGKLLWSVPFVPTSPQNALTPVFQDGYVFVACGHSTGGTLMKIDLPSGTASPVWYRKDLDNCHGGAVLIDGKLFGCGCRMGGKSFYCVDFLTGETRKLDRSLGKVAITSADGMLYALNHQGDLNLLAVTPEGFDVVSQFSLGKRPPNTYLAHPVVCGGRLYIRSEQTLHAFDIRAK
ncbi:MAG: PQQ-binding-like beta-propeller repeat protein [Rhodopirellula sp.]|nr:PQQ-binding-like beta-propeller repeat protein [Rhodopirellula sp.]